MIIGQNNDVIYAISEKAAEDYTDQTDSIFDDTEQVS